MSDFTVLHSRGDPVSASRHMLTYFYPNTASTDDNAENPIGDRFKTVYDELFASGAIDYYEINVNYHHPGLSDGDVGTFYDEFTTWYQNTTTNHSDSITYSDYTGAHLGISENFGTGVAASADADGATSWDIGRAGVIGTNDPAEKNGNLAIQEVLHTFIRNDISSVSWMTEDSDHDLGKIYSDGSVSPMATTYEGTSVRPIMHTMANARPVMPISDFIKLR